MSHGDAFTGFPGVAKATAIPNLFFAAVLPAMETTGELLAFLWVSRVVQEQPAGAVRCCSAEQVWSFESARESFERMGGGREGLDAGLRASAELGALLALRLRGEGIDEIVYFVNNPGSRRAVARARAGELKIRPGTLAEEVPTGLRRPGIFRLYEENVGTITPLVGEKLLDAAHAYPQEWIEEAFRTAAEMNVRNWRYIERILQRWAEEGRAS